MTRSRIKGEESLQQPDLTAHRDGEAHLPDEFGKSAAAARSVQSLIAPRVALAAVVPAVVGRLRDQQPIGAPDHANR
ncbi:MAG: hypothetical protein AAGG06_01395 [Pseudomonadota bacterium]